MKVITSGRQLSRVIAARRKRGERIGFVPTMGALHEGHLSLIRRARKESGCVVVSIFVNPLQFGPAEDYSRYPRARKTDHALCRRAGVDLVFSPSVKEVYPAGFRSAVVVWGLGEVLCGRTRPGHFRGVATVVAKLFHIVDPDTAYFGQKDAQQAALIRRLVRDLDFPVRITVCPTVREPDGLAMSSRNAYLSALERRQAPILYRSLQKARALILREGQRDAGVIKRAVRASISRASEARIDYVAVVSKQDLTPLNKIKGECLIAVAVWFGKTRLIDNTIVKVKAGKSKK